ncbi:MAG: metal-sulfur cluster assembly factor [Candidatus Moranbacteria bacterium]|nr:metal-sulfur cluster assembly factor [Candidatus Moranbacteria bacterium]
MKKDKKLFKLLEKVIDPELNLPITDMGLVYGAEIKKNKIAKIIITLTTIGCPLADVICNDIKNVLIKEKNIEKVKVEITFNPPWTPNMMNESAKMELGF